jgi:NAD(P)H dehydrogenase (quinone)
MYAISGITGQVGSAVAETLLAGGHRVRAIVRDRAKGEAFAARGAEIAVADFRDPDSLAQAFRGVTGAFVMLPASFAPAPGFPETKALVTVLRQALAAARPPKVVCLSSIGAHQTSGLGLITALHILEQGLADTAAPLAFLRPGWFLENAAWDVDSAKKSGVIESFLQPLSRGVPMVATADVGRVAAETLLETWSGQRIIELSGPALVSPNDIAESFSHALARNVSARAVPRERWAAIFRAQGTAWPEPRLEMLDGFNSGWIDFQAQGTERRTGRITVAEVALKLVNRA